MTIKKGKIRGILFVKRAGQGTMSEGNFYFLKPLDEYAKRWEEVPVSKKSEIWEDDPILHPLINKKVEIYAEIIEQGKSMVSASITVDYIEIKEI